MWQWVLQSYRLTSSRQNRKNSLVSESFRNQTKMVEAVKCFSSYIVVGILATTSQHSIGQHHLLHHIPVIEKANRDLNFPFDIFRHFSGLSQLVECVLMSGWTSMNSFDANYKFSGPSSHWNWQRVEHLTLDCELS